MGAFKKSLVENDLRMQNLGNQATHWSEQGLQAHFSETVERARCSVAVLGLLEAQASRKTRGKAVMVSGGTGSSPAFDACGHFPEGEVI